MLETSDSIPRTADFSQEELEALHAEMNEPDWSDQPQSFDWTGIGDVEVPMRFRPQPKRRPLRVPARKARTRARRSRKVARTAAASASGADPPAEPPRCVEQPPENVRALLDFLIDEELKRWLHEV